MRSRATEAQLPQHPAPARAPASPQRDAGTSNIIGTLLLALITIMMALAFSDFVVQVVPEPTGKGPLDLGLKLDAGASQWGDGDERVVIIHEGGQILYENGTTINIEIGSQVHQFSGTSLGSAFSDGSFTIGETWSTTLTIPASSTVLVDIVEAGPPTHLAASARLRSGAQDCSTDTTPPIVSSWSQDPSDVSGATLGAVTVTATASDACSGVNATVTPHLWYRLNDGTDPGFTDLGEMTQTGSTTWEADIPEPLDGWTAHGNETLEYRLDPLEDLEGNTGQSDIESDLIEPGEPAPGTLTYASEHEVTIGTLTGFTALQDANDGGNETTITEAETGSGATTSEIYGTAHSSSGVTAPGNATGSPDDGHATIPTDRDWLGIRGFNTLSGAIQTVELGFEGHYEGTATDGEDEIEIAYEVSSSEGPTTESLNLSELSSGSDGPAVYVNVTSDRAWTWEDISNMLVKATYTKTQGEDDVDFFVDALWVRVSYDDPAYRTDVQINVTGVPDSSDQTLELEYRIDDETHDVQVYNHTAASWATVGARLTETTVTNWTYSLDGHQVSDTGDVWLRILDDAPDATSQSSVHLDFVRVRTR